MICQKGRLYRDPELPTLSEAREVVYRERKQDAIKVFDTMRSAIVQHKHVRRGQMFNFRVELDATKDRVIIHHPSYGRVKFETPVVLVAWILKNYC